MFPLKVKLLVCLSNRKLGWLIEWCLCLHVTCGSELGLQMCLMWSECRFDMEVSSYSGTASSSACCNLHILLIFLCRMLMCFFVLFLWIRDLSNNHIGGSIPSNLPVTVRNLYVSNLSHPCFHEFSRLVPELYSSYSSLNKSFIFFLLF